MTARYKLASYLAAFGLGAILWVPFRIATVRLGWPGNDAWILWFWIGYPLLLLSSLFAGYKLGTGVRGPIAILGSYIAALFLIPHTGNLLPFELVFMGVLSVPAAIAELIGGRFHRHRVSNTGTS